LQAVSSKKTPDVILLFPLVGLLGFSDAPFVFGGKYQLPSTGNPSIEDRHLRLTERLFGLHDNQREASRTGLNWKFTKGPPPLVRSWENLLKHEEDGPRAGAVCEKRRGSAVDEIAGTPKRQGGDCNQQNDADACRGDCGAQIPSPCVHRVVSPANVST
jgi:hypothetical protein